MFIVALGLLMGAEAMWAKRERTLSRRARWPGAIVLLMAGAIVGRLALPIGLAGLAVWQSGVGLFHHINLPGWAEFALVIIILDFAVWVQHVAMHHVPVLWRIHRVHHADPDIDTVTALRFHPAEIILSLVWKGAVIVALGASAQAVLVFEILLSTGALFNHANLAIPTSFDRVVRWGIVTPDMHRVHHSALKAETNSNFGFFLPWWDRLFATYRAQPKAGHDGMKIGLSKWRSAQEQSPRALLLNPLKAD